MATIKDGNGGTDQLKIDATSKAARVTLYDSNGRELSVANKATYAIASEFTPAATPTDMVIIEGSATKTIRILSISIGTTNTAAGSQQFYLIKRSTADTTGTFVSAGTPVPLDSTNSASTVNRVGHFTANPGALGTSVGILNLCRASSPAAIPATWAGIRENANVELIPCYGESNLGQSITLRGVAQTLAKIGRAHV